MKLIFIYITNSSYNEARNIAKYLIKEKLVACANIYDDVKSIYRWESEIVEEKECILIVKTTEDKFERVKKEVEKIHSYSVPCIVKIPVEANEKYFNWIKNEVV